jgi:hypothetical protein
MRRYLFLMFSKIFETQLKPLGWGTYNKWLNQIDNPDEDPGVIYPACFIDINTIQTNTMINGRTVEGVQSIDFHICFETAESTRLGDPGQQYAFDGYSRVDQFASLIDGEDSSTLQQKGYINITKDESFFGFGPLDRTGTRTVEHSKAIKHYIITYSFDSYDQSRYYNNIDYISMTSLSSCTIGTFDSGYTSYSSLYLGPYTGSTIVVNPFYQAGLTSGVTYASSFYPFYYNSGYTTGWFEGFASGSTATYWIGFQDGLLSGYTYFYPIAFQSGKTYADQTAVSSFDLSFL